MKNSFYSSLHHVGLSLVLVGVPYGMYLNQFFRGIEWSSVLMVISIFLIANWRNLFKLSFPSFTKKFYIILLFQSLMILYGQFTVEMVDSMRFYEFHLYVIALILCISTIPQSFKIDSFSKYSFWCSLGCTLLGAACMYTGLLVGEEVYYLKRFDPGYSLEVFTASFGCLVNFFSALCLVGESRTMRYKLFLGAIMLLDIYLILFCGKRSPLFALLVGLVIYVYLYRIKLYNWKIILAFIVVICVLYNISPIIQQQFQEFLRNMYNGTLNMLGDRTVSDASGSGIQRYTARLWAYDYIARNFSYFSYFFGAGYMTKWLDNPILQSFLDMGLLGLYFYLLIIVYYPLRLMYKRIKFAPLVLIELISLYAILTMFNSGNPYQYIKYTPVVLLFYFYKKSEDKRIIS